MSLFDEKDMDFELLIDNETNHTIEMKVKLIGDVNRSDIFILDKRENLRLKTLETDGNHLHFLSQSTVVGKALVAMSAQRNGLTFERASINCSRIELGFKLELTDQEIQYNNCLYEHTQQRWAAIWKYSPQRDYMEIFLKNLTGKTLSFRTRPESTTEESLLKSLCGEFQL